MDYCRNNDIELRKYQVAIADWINKHGVRDDQPDGQRGMIVQYDTGTGKTIVAANVAEMLLAVGRVDNVLVITPKSLVTNFKKALRICLGMEKVPSHYKIMSYDEYRLHPVEFNPRMLLIVDEVHNLRNNNNGRTKAIVGRTELLRHVLVLTATPYVNGPHDISIPARLVCHPDEQVNFPLDADRFKEMYNNKPDAFVAALRNKIAVFRGSDDMPAKPAVTVHKKMVELTDEQIDAISLVYNVDLGPRRAAILEHCLRSGILPSSDKVRMNAFLNKVRRLSNVLGTNIVQPKVKKLVETAVAGPKPVVIYSEFNDSGITNVRQALLNASVPEDRMAVFNGSISMTKRQDIVDRYNTGRLDYLLLTAAGAEGVSLRHTRQIHVLEPYWNMSRLFQVQGRGIRIDSHNDLPPEERRVDVYYWLSVKEGADLTKVPDVTLLNIATRKQEEIKEYERLNELASIPVDVDDATRAKAKFARTITEIKRKQTKRSTSDERPVLRPTVSKLNSMNSMHHPMPNAPDSLSSKRIRPNTSETTSTTIRPGTRLNSSSRKIKSDSVLYSKTKSKSKKTIGTKSKSKKTIGTKSKPKPKSKQRTRTPGPCTGRKPPCPDSCTPVKSCEYINKQSGKLVRRSASCRKKRT